jgi:hypothetical protein
MTDFKSDVLLAFSGLAARFGLACELLDDRLARFQNYHVFLSVHYDVSRSHELGVEIGERTKAGVAERPFNLGEILRSLSDFDNAAWVCRLRVSDEVHLKEFLEKLATLVEEGTGGLLAGDAGAFAKLSDFRNEESRKYAIDAELRMARRVAEAAWLAKDYRALIGALEPFHRHLSEVERKRLSYAKARIDPE